MSRRECVGWGTTSESKNDNINIKRGTMNKKVI